MEINLIYILLIILLGLSLLTFIFFEVIASLHLVVQREV